MLSFDKFDLIELEPLIDWTPFFRTWDLVGKYPRILEDERIGKAANELFTDARSMLKQIVKLNKTNAKLHWQKPW